MPTPPPAAKKRILVIEDEAAVRSTLERYITLSGYDVGFAESGAEALKQLAVMLPDLILLDISLPEIDGLTLLQQLHERYERINVIMLATDLDMPKAQQALTYGACDYLHKPVDLPALKRTLQIHLPIR